LIFDPKKSKNKFRSEPFTGDGVDNIVVFVIGGGNYAEFSNLIERKDVLDKRRITYGCTEMLNGNGFLKQIHKVEHKN
jgi:hypothetical protein